MMRNLIICLLFSFHINSQVVSSRVPVPYRFGYEGIEIIAKTKSDSTIVYSHNGAKPAIRTEVGQSIVHQYSNGLLKNGSLTVNIHCATVKGIVSIVRRGKLISIKFKWNTVAWSNNVIYLSRYN